MERSFQEKNAVPRTASPCEEDTALHSLSVGPGSPVLLQDTILHETLETFVHEKLVERAVHAKGFGALGYFLTERSMQEFTTLSFLQTVGRRTPVAARFSLAAGGPGTPDTSRNIRGFSTKFYAEDGNFDLLCNHIPVFLVRDAIRFPEAIAALRPSPESGLSSPERFWSFAAQAPEALHFITWLYSDYGTMKSLRHLPASSVNAYVWRDAQGRRRYVKYHWQPVEGAAWLSRQEAVRLAGENPDIAGQELYETIAAGNPAEYRLSVQILDPAAASQLPYHPLDCTKLWDEERFPLLPVGRLVLDRNPTDYRQQVEKIAFSPANLLPGAELSEDKLLQGRSFIYWDAQRYRLGAGFREIPINSRRNRAPWSPDSEVTSGIGETLSGTIERSGLPDPDNFTQAGERYRSLPEIEREHLTENIAAELRAVQPDTRSTVLGYFQKADPELADKIQEQM
ncbi:MAG: catalase [Provencibacterium sp.]|nr:catalase [Provencibacterium sp.]